MKHISEMTPAERAMNRERIRCGLVPDYTAAPDGKQTEDSRARDAARRELQRQGEVARIAAKHTREKDAH